VKYSIAASLSSMYNTVTDSLLIVLYSGYLWLFAAKGSYDAHAEKRVEELQARIRELERQNGQIKEKVRYVIAMVFR